MSLNIALLYGSVRQNRKGIHVARFVAQQVEARGHTATLIDPLELPLPLLDKMYKEYPAGEAPENMEKIAQILTKADGFLVVSGEYNHSVPPALKNMLDHFQKEYFYKPSGLVTYSPGAFGGARVAMHLRNLTGELGMPSIPSIMYFSKIGQVFNSEGKLQDEAYLKRITRFLNEFDWYAEALQKQRALGTP
ncbi:NADPH-dependent FMN reductase [Microscilla marina]|uniref:NADPH-dependent fmn reductase, putative n=1 Tax=Microscilla marina ATCC 23134 TaxID=313606 RepID=A1ZW59_MICM2|nr:NAD(P)H-dependent oxidoreductase [Microscilla marina]EAY25422.1 NADPH-dependent fmn reductase, putative [Microscilla marina ATCC 23134]